MDMPYEDTTEFDQNCVFKGRELATEHSVMSRDAWDQRKADRVVNVSHHVHGVVYKEIRLSNEYATEQITCFSSEVVPLNLSVHVQVPDDIADMHPLEIHFPWDQVHAVLASQMARAHPYSLDGPHTFLTLYMSRISSVAMQQISMTLPPTLVRIESHPFANNRSAISYQVGGCRNLEHGALIHSGVSAVKVGDFDRSNEHRELIALWGHLDGDVEEILLRDASPLQHDNVDESLSLMKENKYGVRTTSMLMAIAGCTKTIADRVETVPFDEEDNLAIFDSIEYEEIKKTLHRLLELAPSHNLRNGGFSLQLYPSIPCDGKSWNWKNIAPEGKLHANLSISIVPMIRHIRPPNGDLDVFAFCTLRGSRVHKS